ncbi:MULTISPECIES: VirB4 family type IV secretion/conjugal transfer ATPase [unclassified Novosphingobium]|uniref:VirB4 family type IV secretion/conjugal transfer ATPase n=1 Tax=unclassified Novosphingobium TaxID=2644732 RepID=UPI00146E1284|nr:type IV secretion system protein VirB4 [Novosphingobium sp. SG919]NMN89849.1 type IV secretion system protein VirB4 [Novosphingobium sp. SG916]
MAEAYKVIKSDPDPVRFLPYARHVNEHVLQLENGELMAVMRLDGIPFETADIATINDWHEKLNGAWRVVAHERVAFYSHLLRRGEFGYPGGTFRSEFAADLDAAYRKRILAKQMFVNEHYLTVIYRPAVGVADKAASSIFKAFSKNSAEEAEEEMLEKFTEVLRDAAKLLGKVDPVLLGTYEHNGLMFSETLEFLARVMTGRSHKLPLVRGHLGQVLYRDRLIFGREVVEIREPGGSRFAGILAVREHAARTYPGQLNALLEANFEFVLGQGFAFLGKHAGMETARRKRGQMSASDDAAFSQMDQLDEAMDDLQSNRFVLGEHHLALTVFGETVKSLGDNMSVARAALSESGIVAAREDLALEAAYWSQLPGNFTMRTRPAALTSRNFAALSPFHTYPMGKRSGNHWGDAIALLKTPANSPYYFNFHVRDVGHSLILGPTGGGKTVIQNFLLAQAEKTGARIIFIDKDRGAEIFVRACGGTYLALKNGEKSGFSPLKALEHTPRNREFLLSWLRLLVSPAGEELSAQEQYQLSRALDAVGRLPLAQRSLTAIRTQLDQTSLEGIGPRLERWTEDGELGWVFDNPADTLALDAQFMGFDMTDFLDNEAIRPALMKYLFFRIEGVLASEDAEVKQPVIVDIDEFWKALGDASFRDFVRDALKTWRKRNAMIMFGTQSAADALKSEISDTIVEQCATKIILPNPNAHREHYIDGLNLTEAEFRLIKVDLSQESRRFLVKQDQGSVVVELDLAGLDDELAVLSGRSGTVALLEEIRSEVGDDPAIWLPLFRKRWRTGGRG